MKMPDQRRRQIKNNESELVYLDAITTIGNMVVEARKNRDSEKLRQMAIAIQQIAFLCERLTNGTRKLILRDMITLLNGEEWQEADILKRMDDDSFYYGHLGKHALSSSSLKKLLQVAKGLPVLS
jgi:hypothetical protein